MKNYKKKNEKKKEMRRKKDVEVEVEEKGEEEEEEKNEEEDFSITRLCLNKKKILPLLVFFSSPFCIIADITTDHPISLLLHFQQDIISTFEPLPFLPHLINLLP